MDDCNDYEIKDGEIEVHGIRIASRYNEIDELNEMTAFCGLAEKFHLKRYIKRIFYNSKTSVCIFKTYIPLQENDPVFCAIVLVADMVLTQYELCSVVYCPREDAKDIYSEDPLALQGVCMVPEVETIQ